MMRIEMNFHLDSTKTEKNTFVAGFRLKVYTLYWIYLHDNLYDVVLKVKKKLCLFSLYVVSKSNRSDITNAVFISKLQIQTMQQINDIGRFDVIGSTMAK